MPELAISAEKVGFLIEKMREFDVKEGNSDPDSGSEFPSLTSNSRIFSIKKPTFSAEMASSGINALLDFGVSHQRAWKRDDPLRGGVETSIFRPKKQDAMKAQSRLWEARQCTGKWAGSKSRKSSNWRR